MVMWNTDFQNHYTYYNVSMFMSKMLDSANRFNTIWGWWKESNPQH